MTNEDIKTEIFKACDTIKNEYNIHSIIHFLDRIDSVVDHIIKITKGTDNKSIINNAIDLRLENFKKTEIQTFSKIILVDGDYGQYFLYVRTETGVRIIEDFYANTLEEAIKIATEENTIREQGFKEVKHISFPTGNIVFTNFFSNKSNDDYKFDLPKNIKYDNAFSINSNRGQQNTMNYLADTFQLGYAQLGNTTCAVYKKSETEIIITTAYLCTHNDGGEIDIPITDSYEYMGSIECAVWRTEFMDTTFLNDQQNIENDQILVNVSAGDWSFKNYYAFCDDELSFLKGEVPIWIELKKN